MRKTYEEGEILFSEGDPSDYVVRIEAGTVDVLRDLGGESIALGTVKAGEFLGEMGVIEGEPRSASARAASVVEAEVLTPDLFFARVSSDPETARELIVRLSARLRGVQDRLVEAIQGGRGEAERAAPAPTRADTKDAGEPTVAIAARSPDLERQMGGSAHRTMELPFIVGRQPDEGEPSGGVPADLSITERAPHRLSPSHFILLIEYGEPVVRDLSSTLGTIVNGRSIGREFPTDVATLDPGENLVLAGGRDSPHRFSITVG